MKPNRTIPWVAAMAAIFWTATAVAGSPDPKQPRSKANAPAESIKMPTAVSSPRPRVKLDDQAVNAISKPRVPAVQAIQDQKPAIKPAQVPVKVVQPPQKPAKPEMVQRPVKPMAPSTSPGARVERPVIPDVLDDRQARQIQQAREVAEVARIARELNTDIHQAARMPERAVADSAAGTAFEGYGPAVMGNGPDANQIIHELYFGRLGGIDSVGIGKSKPADPMFTGPGTAGGQFSDGGIAGQDSSGNSRSRRRGRELVHQGPVEKWPRRGERDAGWSQYAVYDNGDTENMSVFVRTPWKDEEGNIRPGGLSWSRETLHEDGSSTTRTGFDAHNNGRVDAEDRLYITETDANGRTRTRACQGGECGDWSEWSDPEPDNSGADDRGQPDPTGRTVGPVDKCNFNPITGKCQGPAQSRVYDGEMIGQPSPTDEGDQGPGPGTPNVGPIAVTNPGDNPNLDGNGNGGRGINAPGGTPMNPDPPGPESGSLAVASAGLPDAALDAALGELGELDAETLMQAAAAGN